MPARCRTYGHTRWYFSFCCSFHYLCQATFLFLRISEKIPSLNHLLFLTQHFHFVVTVPLPDVVCMEGCSVFLNTCATGFDVFWISLITVWWLLLSANGANSQTDWTHLNISTYSFLLLLVIITVTMSNSFNKKIITVPEECFFEGCF